MSTIPRVLLFIVMIVTKPALAESSSFPSAQFETVDMTELTVVSGVLLESDFATTSTVTCGSACLMRSDCQMFSYDIWRGECRVDVILKHDVTSTVPDGVVFYGRKEGNCPVTKGYSLTTAGGQTACLRVYLAHTLPAEAEEKCGQDGSHMYRVENEEKKAIMTKHVHERDYPLTFYWIDGRRQSSGSYTFVLGNGATVSAGSSLWCPGEPSSAYDPCVHFRFECPGTGLNERPCTGYRDSYVICEVDI